MQRHITIFVANELFRGEAVPSKTSRRYFPKKKDIRNHMYIAASKLRFSKLDQENLLLKVEDWKKQFPDDEIFFRGYGEKDENELIVDNNGSDDDDSEDIKVCLF